VIDKACVLIFAPLGRDGAVASAILGEVGIAAEVCPSLDALVAGLDGATCAVVTEEALLGADRRHLAGWVNLQPPWSDFPFVLLTVRGGSPDPRLPDMLGNVTVLERPFHPGVLVSAVRSGLRARRRQREVEAHLIERQRTHERQSLLIRELHHRVRNTLATVQSLLGATARSTQSIGEFYRSFSDRIVSLSQTHNLLTEDYWQTAQFDQILRNELGPYDDGASPRVVLDGPGVELSADLAVPTGMAIHELTTNAAKHGALSVPGGRIEVNWSVRQAEAGRRLAMAWTERGGPPVEQPRHKGFGSTLIQRVLAQQCNAEIRLDYAREGLRFTMDVPLLEKRQTHPAASHSIEPPSS
jgi:two-component sensor histidine kinase